MRKTKKILLYTFTGLFLAAGINEVNAQFSFTGFAKNKSKKTARKTPTSIVADSMDIDFKNNLATFTGNVLVDDPAMTIKCHKMQIFLQEKKKTETSDKESKEKEAKEDSNASLMTGGGSKELNKIVCQGDVVIVRKLDATDKGGEQKATAGKAVYYVKTEMIVLTEDKPTIQRGSGNKLSGSKITLWLGTERLQVESKNRKERAVINIENLKSVK